MHPSNFENIHHPVKSQIDFRVDTLAMRDVLNTFQGYIYQGIRGALLEGDSREGKTTVLSSNLDKFTTRDGTPIQARLITIPDRDKKTIRAVYRCIARQLKLPFKRYASSDDIAEQVLHYLSDLASIRNVNTVILIIDEIQRLIPKQLEPFAELMDALEIANIRLIVFSAINSSSSVKLLEQLSRKKHDHIRGRFFTRKMTFKSFTSLKEIRYALKQYDSLHYPENNGPSYTEYFLSKDYQQGFRLSDTAEILWDSFHEEIKKPLNLKSWPAQYFFSTVNLLLIDFLPKHGVKEFNEDMAIAAIEASGIMPSKLI